MFSAGSIVYPRKVEVSDPVSDEDEYALIRRIVAGERDEFRVLVDRHKDLIFGMIMRQLQDRSIAEEIAQESFINAYKALKTFRFDSKFSTWLTRIALNQLSNYYSSKTFKKNKITKDLDSQINEPSDDHKRHEIISRLRDGIAHLSNPHRQVIILCGVEGRSYEEAAKIVNAPVGTIRSRLNAARQALRDILLSPEKEDV